MLRRLVLPPLLATLSLSACTDVDAPAARRSTPPASSVSPSPAAPPASPAASPSPSSTAPAGAHGPVEVFAEVALRLTPRTGGNPAVKYSWSAPRIDVLGLGAAATARIEAALEARVVRLRRDPQIPRDVTVTVDAHLHAVSSELLTVLLDQDVQPDVSAHGKQARETHTFRRSDGRELDLADLFRSDPLPALSRAVRAALPIVTGASLLDDRAGPGTAPRAGNFATVTPRPEGLEVIFQNYQVASYAAGFVTVTVPWADLPPLAVRRPDGLAVPYLGGYAAPTRLEPGIVKAVESSPEIDAPEYVVRRVVLTQRSVGRSDYALATVVPVGNHRDRYDVLTVVLHDTATGIDPARWSVVSAGDVAAACEALPADAAKSFLLPC